MFDVLNNNTILQNSNLFKIGFFDYKILQGYFEILQIGYYFKWPSEFLNFEPSVWYTFCLICNVDLSSVQFLVNDLVVSNISVKRYSGKFSYSLSTNLNSDPAFPFMGKITDLNMWNKPLTPQAVSLFSKCKMNEFLQLNIGMPIKWSEGLLNFNSNEAKTFNISNEELCPEKPVVKLKIFNSLMKFDEAKSVCEQFDSQMKLPMDYDDFKELFDIENQYLMKNICEGQMWLPIVRSPDNDTKWLNVYKPS